MRPVASARRGFRLYAPSLVDVVRMGILCALYVSAAKVGLSLDAVSGFATAVWPPTGIALVALTLFGYRLWPGITVAAFLVNASAGAPVPVASGMAVGNTLEAMVGTYLLHRVVGFQPALARLRDVFGLVILAAGQLWPGLVDVVARRSDGRSGGGAAAVDLARASTHSPGPPAAG
jgi:integral membrane sensor domain MASE1